MVRAKFYVQDITPQEGENPGSVKLYPVISGSKENERFFQCTPAGEIRLYVLNPAALAEFEVGKGYYIDFTKTE